MKIRLLDYWNSYII